ncbi:MAG: hypothetical protein ACLTKE_01325 [Coprococcus sp.]
MVHGFIANGFDDCDVLIAACNVKSADKVDTMKVEKTSLRQMVHIILKNDQFLVAIGIILTFNFAIQVIAWCGLTYYFILCDVRGK